MPRHLRWIWLAMALLSVAGMLAVWRMPADWEVQRQLDLEATPDQLFEQLIDFERWPEWSPWLASDYEDLEFVYSGSKRGVGAFYTWDSETTGDGRLEIIAADRPREIVFTMSMQGGKILTTETLSLEAVPGGTRLTWSDRGELKQTLLGRLSVPVIQESMGRDLDLGLRRLAEWAAITRENPAAGPNP